MIINIDNGNRVVWYNTELNREQAQQYLDNFTFYVESILIPQPKQIEGKEAILYFSQEKGFYYEYTNILPQPPSPSDSEIIMQSISELELQNFEAQAERQLLAQQISDLELAMLEGGSTDV